MDYSKFYTPPEVAELLINQLRIPAPTKTVDICCGSCNLLNAVKKRWKKTELYGADIANCDVDNIHFLRIDGREYAAQHKGEFSLVVANPPFDSLEKKCEYPDIFRGAFKELKTSRLEVEMLLANLLMLEENGCLVIILPSSFVEAISYNKTRKLLAQNYYIRDVIKLADDTFGATHISSYALIVQNCKKKKYRTKLYMAKKSERGYRTVLIDQVTKAKMEAGNWLNETCRSNKCSVDIKRGNISSAMFAEQGNPVLHTAKPAENWYPSIRYVSQKESVKVFAESGDIIVSRIGKSAGLWCVYKGEKALISDCLYCIKDPDGELLRRINGRTYNLPLKGVATRYITMNDFVAWAMG